MAHKLTIRTDGSAEMFSGNNAVPWHKLGTVVSGMLTADKALKAAKIDWTVSLKPVFNEKGKPIEGYSAVTRNDNGNELSIMGGRYTAIQNSEAMDFLDSIVGEGQAVYDTAGSIEGGATVWIMAKLSSHLFVNKNDKIEQNVLLYKSHAGKGMKVKLIATRVVCWNTLSAALRERSNEITIRHTRTYKSKIEEAQRVLGLASGYFSDLKGLLEKLSAAKFSKDKMASFSRDLFAPELAKKDEIPTRTQNNIDTLVSLFDRGTGNEGKTRFDALNAVTEFVDHKRSTRTNAGDGASEEQSATATAESRFAASLFGSGAALKARATEMLVAPLGKN